MSSSSLERWPQRLGKEPVLVSCGCRNKVPPSQWLKTTEIILLQFWSSGNQFHWSKVRVSAELVPSEGSEGRIHFFALQFLVVTWIPWLVDSSSIFKAHYSNLCFVITLPSPLTDSSCIPLIRTIVIILGPSK